MAAIGTLLNQLLENQNKKFYFDNFTSPFFDEIKDPADLQQTFNKLPAIPFFGNEESSSDQILKTLHRHAETVPVVAGIVESIKDFCISAGITLKQKNGLGVLSKRLLDVEQNVINDFEAAFLDTFIETDLTELCEASAKSLAIDGNGGFIVTVERVTGKAKIQYINTNNFRYLDESLVGEKGVIIASSFLYSSITTIEPITLTLYPNFKDEDGVLQTFIHAKKPTPNRNLYGLSNLASSIMQQYLLNQLTVYLSAETDNRFTGKVFFDIPISSSDLEGDGESDVKDFEENQKNTFTSKGTTKSSIMNHYRFGEEKVEITQFNANTEHEFFDTIINLLEAQILKAAGWNKSLIGDNSDAGLFGEKLESVYMGASQKVRSIQNIITTALNKCFAFVEDTTGKDLRGGNVLHLNSVYEQMMKEKETVESESLKEE